MRIQILVLCLIVACGGSVSATWQVPVVVDAEPAANSPTAFDAVRAALGPNPSINPTNFGDPNLACGDRPSGDCFRPTWFAGTDMSFVYVDARPGGVITSSIDDSDTAGLDFAVSDRGGVQDQTYVPRIYVGRRIGEKWSIVARYWHLDAFDYSIPDVPSGHVNLPHFATVKEFSNVELYNLDLEAMRSGRIGRWEIDGAIGARHSSFYSDQTINMFGVFTSGNFIQLFQSHFSSFDGTGITAALNARRPIGNSCCSMYVSARGSNAWGLAGASGPTSGIVVSSPSTPLVGAATVSRFDAEGQLAIGEFQVGLQWERRLKCVPANAFFRAGAEYQYWTLQMPPIGGTGFGGTINDITVSSFNSVNEGKAELFGLTLGAGFTW